MQTTLPSWIKIDGALGDISSLLREFETYAELARHWRDIAVKLRDIVTGAPLDSPVNLATYLAGHIDDPEVVEAFDKLELSGLRGRLSDLSGKLTDEDAPWSKLLRPAGEFVETYTDRPKDEVLDDGDNPGLITLSIPKQAADAATTAGPAALSFSVAAEAGLQCEAGAVWPFRGDSVPPGLLRIGAEGAVAAKAGVSLPFGKIGKGGATADASAEAEMHYYYRPKAPDAPYAEALASAILHIPNPLDLSDVNHAVQLFGMEGLALRCQGSVSAGLSAALGADQDFGQLVSVSASVVGRVDFKREARWVLSIRSTADGLRFVLGRNLNKERDWSLGVDIGVDYSGLARQVHDALAGAANDLGPRLDAIRPFLSPGTYIAEKAGGVLNATISSITAEPELRDALLHDLGRVLGQKHASDLALSAYLKDRIIELAADHAGGVLSKPEDWARHIAQGLSARFPELGADDAVDKLVARIKPMLGDVKQQFDGIVTKLVALPDIAQALDDVGVELDNALAEADRMTAGIRKLVADFDAFSRDLLEKTGEGVEHKLSARFEWSGGSSNGVQYELMGTFSEVNSDTAALWRALVTGQVEPFQRILSDPASAPAGLTLDPASGLARFAGKHRGFALEVVAFGATVSIRSIIKGEARITLNAGGDVTVAATGEAEREIVGFSEGRNASFVSRWDLALLKGQDPAVGGTRKMGLSIGFSHNDKNLKLKEVVGILGDLRDIGLIESARFDKADGVYRKWQEADQLAKKVKGQISVNVALTRQAVLRMVTIGRLCGEEESDPHRAVFTAAAKALLDAGATDQAALDRDCHEARKDHNFRALRDVQDPWQMVYALRNRDLTPPSNSIQREHHYNAFEKLQELPKNFPRLLWQMAQIYDAIPVGAVSSGKLWSEKDYVRAELALADDARKWLRLNKKLIGFKSGIHPAMVAFLRLLADMNQIIAPGDPLDSLGTRVGVATSNSLFTIAMKGPDGKAIMI